MADVDPRVASPREHRTTRTPGEMTGTRGWIVEICPDRLARSDPLAPLTLPAASADQGLGMCGDGPPSRDPSVALDALLGVPG